MKHPTAQVPERQWSEGRKLVNEAHISVAREVKYAGFVSSDGLICRGDQVHLNATSQRVFGRRYAQTYLQLVETE